MVVNGCLLEEAYGDYTKKVKKTKKRDGDINKEYKKSGRISPYDDYNKEVYYPVNRNYYHQENHDNNYKTQSENETPVVDNQEKTILLNDKDYRDYLKFQEERHKYVHQKDIIESFSNVNDNFNDVLIFALFGIIFLIFTDYIYKLGKKSY